MWKVAAILDQGEEDTRSMSPPETIDVQEERAASVQVPGLVALCDPVGSPSEGSLDVAGIVERSNSSSQLIHPSSRVLRPVDWLLLDTSPK